MGDYRIRMDIKKSYKEVGRLLDGLRLNAAFKLLASMLEFHNLRHELQELGRLRENYGYMVKYMMEGGSDTDRPRMLADLSERARSLADKALRADLAVADPRYYYSAFRFNTLRKESVGEILEEYGRCVAESGLMEASGQDVHEQHRKSETLLERLFNTLYTSLGADADYKHLTSYATSGYAEQNAVLIALSAMTLGLLEYYDRPKFKALLDICDNAADETVAARAMLGIVLTLAHHGKRVQADKELCDRLSLWRDDLMAYRRLRETVRVIVATRDTDRISTKMKEEILPEIMKLRPEIMARMEKLKDSTDDAEALSEGLNPEWEEMLDKSGLSEKMKELTELQSDGADLMMMTFSNLKGFSFFNKASNWFMPFDKANTELDLPEEMGSFLEMMESPALGICDSDLYSLALGASRMPEAQRKMMAGQFGSQMDQLQEQWKEGLEKSVTPAFDRAIIKSARDMYRFFRLFRKRTDFYDPFSEPLPFTQLPVVGDMMLEDEILELIGNFYFKRGYWAEALPLFESLASAKGADPLVWERTGYCRQRTGDLEGALEAYSKASLLKTPGPWLTQRLAYISKRLGKWKEASAHYHDLLEMEPENISAMLNAGFMLLETGELEQGKAHFYHALYLSPDEPKVLRAIAWAELLNRDFNKSLDYYGRAISSGARPADYLNAGHAALLSGNIKEAANFYSLARDTDPEGFESNYRQDIKTLVGLGADESACLLLLDKTLG